MIDNTLLFVAGMIIGGFIYVKIEAFVKNRYSDYPMKRFGQIVTFASVFFIAVNYLTVKYIFLYGIFAGILIFSFIPQMTSEE